jgi:ribose 5-phosphate isomerase B
MKVAIGNDELGVEMKTRVVELLDERGIEVVNYGVNESDDKEIYPNLAKTVAEAVKDGKADRGILICGTGIGMAITANKIPGIRAAQVHDPYSAERARASNDAHIMTMGAKVIAPDVAVMLVDIWLDAEFQGGRSQPKVDRMVEIEEENLSKK